MDYFSELRAKSEAAVQQQPAEQPAGDYFSELRANTEAALRQQKPAEPPEGFGGYWADLRGDTHARAGELMHRSAANKKPFDEVAPQLLSLGFDPESLRKHYGQQHDLQVEREKQIADRGGKGVGTLEQFGRKSLPFVSSVRNFNRAEGYAAATERFKKGEATAEDLQSIAAFERLQKVDQHTPKVLSVFSDAPAIIGEGLGASKVLGAAGRTLGLVGKAAPAGEAAGYTAKGTFTYAGKALPVTLAMPSMYLDQAAQKNIAAGRKPDDIKGLAPAAGMAYANVLVLGQLQKLGNTAQTFAGQVARKGGYGVLEQQIADAAVGGIDQVLPKGWEMADDKTRFGVVGDLARGKVGDAMEHAALQMLTFSYFAGLHGKQPRPVQTTFKEAVDEASKMGLSADASARYVDYPRLLLGEALQKNPNLTGEEARAIIEQHAPKKGALREYGLSLADALPRAELANDFTARTVAEKARRDGRETGLPEKPIYEEGRRDPEEEAALFRYGEERKPLADWEVKRQMMGEKVRDPADADRNLADFYRKRENLSAEEANARAAQARERDVTTDDPLNRMGDEGPVSDPQRRQPPQAERPGEPAPTEPPRPPDREQVPEKEPEPKSPLDGLNEIQVQKLAEQLGVVKAGAKVTKPKREELEQTIREFEDLARKNADVRPRGPEKAPGPEAPPEAPKAAGAKRGPLETAPRGQRSHIANYKDPARSVDKAVEMLGKRGSAPLPLETWHDPENARGQASDGTATFVMDTTNYTGEIVGRKGIDNLRNSKFPLPYDPALERVVFKGDAEGEKYAKLQHAVYAMNHKRADAALMKSFGHDGPLPPVKLEVTGKGHGLDRLIRVDRRTGVPTDGAPQRRSSDKQVPEKEPAKEVDGPATAMYERLKAEGVPYTEAFLRATEQGKTVTGEKFAADRVATIPAPTNAKATAERRSAPRTNKPTRNDEVSDAERAQNERIEKTTYDSIPKVYRDQIEQLIPEYTKRGYKAEAVRDSYRVIFGAAGRGGVEASIDLFRARTEPISEKLLKVSMANAAHAEKELDDAAREAGGHAEGGVEKWREYAAGAAERLRNTPDDERFRGAREDAERWERVKRDLDEGVRRADEAANGGRAAEAPEPAQPRQTEGKKVKEKKPKAERVKTILDDVIEAGGIYRDRTIEGDFNPKEFPHLSRPGLWNASGKAHSLDTMAEHLGMSTDELTSALKEQRVSHIQDNAKAFDAKYDRELREKERAAREEGDTQDWKPSDEGIPESRGPRPGEPGHVPEKEGGPGPFEIIAEQNRLFDNRNYVEKRVPHVGSAANAVALKSGGIVTAKMSAGSALVNLEENAHHVHMKEKLPSDPSAFPLEVARGIQEFFAPRAHYYGVKSALKATPTRLGMMEGFADWLIARSTGGLTGLSANQKAANEYLEKWAGDKGLTEKFDAVKEMYRKHAGLSAESKAALNVSATGKPVDEQGRATIAQKAQEMVDDNLTVLNRVIAKAESLGHKVGRGLYDTYSQLMHAAPKWAAQFEKEGVHGYDKEGRRVVVGESWDKIVEGAKPEWLQPGKSGEASRAGTYALARHVLGEEARGRKELVAPAQLEQYRAAMEAFKADTEFAAWAEPFADRLTKAFNASNRALASEGVHFLTPEMNEAMEAKYPDYVPTSRVMQDAGWRAGGGSKGEIVGRAIYERSGSGEQIVDPLISYKNRLASTAARMAEQLKRVELLKIARMDGMADYFLLGEKTLTELGKERAERLTAMGFKGEELKRLLEDMAAARDEEYFTTKPWPTDGTKPTLGVWGRDGKLITMRIGDKALYDLASGQQVEASAAASTLRALTEFWGEWNPFRVMTRVVKFGATTASLGFQFRNIPRDSFEFWKNTVDRATVKDLPGAYKRAFAFAWNQLTQHFGAKASRDTLFKEFDRQRGDQGRQFDFERDKPASAYAPNRGKVVGTAHTIWGVLKDTLRVSGAGELAPRFLEWKTRLQKTTGKTEAQLVEELQAVEKAASEGRSVPDPIPLALGLDALQHAAEVTVNFNRLGSVTREINKITPFFGPAIAGLSKAVRNWKENPKGAAFAMAGLLGLRLLHWLTYSDEDWYKELSANDRYNNFVVPTPAGLRRLPAPRDFEILGGGFLTTMLDAAAGKNPDFKGWAKQSLEGLLPPKPLPPALKVAGEVAANENWMGSPIVPKRDEHASTLDKWTDHRLAYVADQMTGGVLGKRNLPEKWTDLLPYSEVKNARRSVDELYDRYKELEAGHAKAKSSGLRFAEEAEYRRLDAAQKRIADLSRALRGERIVDGRVRQIGAPSDEDKARIKSIQIEIARRALGK